MVFLCLNCKVKCIFVTDVIIVVWHDKRKVERGSQALLIACHSDARLPYGPTSVLSPSPLICLNIIRTYRVNLKEALELYFKTCLPSVIFLKNLNSNFLFVPT